MGEHEKFYDEEIAPKLLELGRLCQEKGLCLLAVVEWTEPEGEETDWRWGSGRTWSVMGDQSGFMNWLNAAAQCGEGGAFNIDKFVIAAARDLGDKPTTSIVLDMLRKPGKYGKV